LINLWRRAVKRGHYATAQARYAIIIIIIIHLYSAVASDDNSDERINVNNTNVGWDCFVLFRKRRGGID